MKIRKSKYLVRKNDYHIWELDPANGCYRSYSNRSVTYPDGTRPNAQSHFTFENLTQNFEFIPIYAKDIPKYKRLGKAYHAIMNKYCESDGHGGHKGIENLTPAEREFVGM